MGLPAGRRDIVIHNPLRHQLASNSPVSVSDLRAGLRAVWKGDRGGLTELEAWIRKAYAVSGVVLCGSGSQALVLALEHAGRLEGGHGRILLPAYSCFDVAAAAVRVGRPVGFYDLDPRTLGPDPDSLRTALREGAGVVVLASLFGVPLDWNLLDPLLAEGEAVTVEDAAQGHGAAWQDRRLGGHGRLGVLSFSRGKGWTGGGGGALLIRDTQDREALEGPTRHSMGGTAAGRASGLHALATAVAQWSLGRPQLYRIPRVLPFLALGETYYRPIPPPTAMSPVSAALLLQSRDRAEAAWREAKPRGVAYREALAELPRVELIRIPAGGEAGYVRFPILLPEGLNSFPRPGKALRLGATRSYPVPLPALTQVERLHGGTDSFEMPGAWELSRRLVTLPTHGQVQDWEMREVLRQLQG